MKRKSVKKLLFTGSLVTFGALASPLSAHAEEVVPTKECAEEAPQEVIAVTEYVAQTKPEDSSEQIAQPEEMSSTEETSGETITDVSQDQTAVEIVVTPGEVVIIDHEDGNITGDVYTPDEAAEIINDMMDDDGALSDMSDKGKEELEKDIERAQEFVDTHDEDEVPQAEVQITSVEFEEATPENEVKVDSKDETVVTENTSSNVIVKTDDKKEQKETVAKATSEGVTIYSKDEKTKLATISTDGKLTVSKEAVEKDYSSTTGYAPWVNYSDDITEVVIEDGTKYIGQNAFIYLKNVIEVKIPDTVTTIGKYAFNGLKKLKEVVLDAALKKIDDHAFYNCKALEKVYMPGNAIYIGEEIIPEDCNVTIIAPKGTIAEQYAKASGFMFEDLPKKTDAKSIAVQKQYVSSGADVVLTSGTQEGTNGTITYKYNYETRTLTVKSETSNNGIKYTKVDDNDLSHTGNNWSGLKDVTETLYVSSNITEVNANAFAGFSRLNKVEFSKDLKKITSAAFRKCANIRNMTFKSGVNTLDNFFTSGNIPSNCIIHADRSVYSDSIYQSAKNAGYTVISTSRDITDMNDASVIPCANQSSDAINSYESKNGHRWIWPGEYNTACVVTSAAMLIERKAFLEGYDSVIGNFNQATVDNIVKEMGEHQLLLNSDWDFYWSGTESFSALKSNGKSFEAHFVNVVPSESTLKQLLEEHPEGVIVRGNQTYYDNVEKRIKELRGHCVLVTKYLGNDNYQVYDPSSGIVIQTYATINGYPYIDNYTMSYIK